VSATIVRLDRETLDRTVEGEGIVFVDWWASWCGPCRSFGPVYERFAARHPDVTCAKVDAQQEQDLAAAAGVRSIPTLMVFRDGILLFSQPGALPESALDGLLDHVRALEMDDVRSQIAAEITRETAPPAP
jgi:thioredoxin 1